MTQIHYSAFNFSTPLNLSLELFQPGAYTASSATFKLKTAAELEEIKLREEEIKLANAAKWKGFEMRADGYPITNLTAADCKSYSPECRQ